MSALNCVSFYLNGKATTVENPSPDLLLIDYRGSPGVGLAGPKKPCGQGGCGGCTVILSRWNAAENRAEQRAINSCLRPVCALGGLVVTTVEGTGAVRRPNPAFLHHSPTFSRGAAPPDAPPAPEIVEAQKEAHEKRQQVLQAVHSAHHATPVLKLAQAPALQPSRISHEGMNPVAHRLALNNGSQCGYCSVGFVMNMSEFIVNHPKATKQEIEDIFDGNICRCTGYRSILTGMKTFASDWTEEDERNRMKCKCDDGCESQLPADVVIPFPAKARTPAEPVFVDRGTLAWHTPASLAELVRIIASITTKSCASYTETPRSGFTKRNISKRKCWLTSGFIPDLNVAPKIENSGLHVGAGVTYSELIEALEKEMKSRGDGATSRLGAMHFMAQRTAGRIVRNAASLGGNTMLVLTHIAAGTGEPFPSDLLTALVAVDAKIVYLDVSGPKQLPLETCLAQELVERVHANPTLAARIVLIRYQVPCGEAGDIVLPQKVALREVNAHSIVNAASRLHLSADLVPRNPVLVFGGIAPFPWRAKETERAMAGKKLSLADAPKWTEILRKEVLAELERWAERMQGLPSEGFTDAYRAELAVSFLYKAIVNALLEQPGAVPPDVRSSGEITWGRWPVSDGTQSYAIQSYKRPVSQPYIKLTAMYQTSGQVHYTHELPVPPLTVNAAFVQSRRALANYFFVIPGNSAPVDADRLRDHLSKLFALFRRSHHLQKHQRRRH